MKTVLITGATGFLGYHLVGELLKNESNEIIAIGGRPGDKAVFHPANDRLRYCFLGELFTESFNCIDTVINCAFPRSNDLAVISDAFDFTGRVISRLEELGVKSLINISSQGVYKRLEVGSLSTEDSPIQPIDSYSLAKYAVEKLFCVSSLPYVTNIRLGSLNMPQRFLFFFVQKAIKEGSFTVSAPKKYAALLDVEDAASGITSLVSLDPQKRQNTYNIGIGTQYSILEYAESVKRIGESLGYNITYDVVDNESTECAGMDCIRIFEDTGWKARITKEMMITRMYKNLKND